MGIGVEVKEEEEEELKGGVEVEEGRDDILIQWDRFSNTL